MIDTAAPQAPEETKRMKPIWIVDDDQSIRFVVTVKTRPRRCWSVTFACPAAQAWI
jgi:hypothetical protein